MNPETIKRYASDPLAFICDLIIPAARGAQRFGDCAAPFQLERLKPLAAALLAMVRGEKPPIGRHFWSGTKGTSKDTDLSLALLYLLAFSPRPLDCQVGANDRDQAGEVRKAMRDILHLNPWLAARITVQNWRIVCEATGSAVDIIAADAAGSHGSRPDVVVINELSHIANREFAETLMDNATKVPHGLVCIATNAGFTDTWQHRWYLEARESEDWYFHAWDRPSPWIDPKHLAAAERRNSRSRYERLYLGRWVSGTGDAIDADDIAAVTDAKAEPMYGDEPGIGLWVAGLDLSIKHDRSSLVVLGVNPTTQTSQLAYHQSWSAGPTGEVDLPEVQAGVHQAALQFNGLNVGFDPYQAMLMAQQLGRAAVNMMPINFVGKHLDGMASALLQTFRTRSTKLYPCPELQRDLLRLEIVEKSYGYKLQAPRDKDGHADLATAFAIANYLVPAAIAHYIPHVPDTGETIFDLPTAGYLS